MKYLRILIYKSVTLILTKKVEMTGKEIQIKEKKEAVTNVLLPPPHFSYLLPYYVNHFPTSLLFELFRITPTREFSFQFANYSVARNLSFGHPTELESFLRNRQVLKIDIGGTAEMEREIVIDVDLTDYSKEINKNISIADIDEFECESTEEFKRKRVNTSKDVHFCGQLCGECLAQMSRLISITNEVLRKKLGFQNILFFFSGNKGFHTYIFDNKMKKLNNFTRESILLFMKRYGIIGDVNVTKDIKHLLKWGFVVHPKNGNVCLPILEEDNFAIQKIHVKDVVEGNISIESYKSYIEEFISNKIGHVV